MYFRNRAQAGRELARELAHFSNQNVAVIALSPGGVIVGSQVAMQLHASMAMLLVENIYLPGEPDAIAAMSSVGTFTYNNMFSPGQLEEAAGEFHQYIEAQRIEKLHKLNMIVGVEGEIKKDHLRHHVVILVSDGLNNAFSLDIAAGYLKTIDIKRLVVATPIASVPAVDRMHLMSDEIRCLSVLPNYMFTDHYYDDNIIPETEDLFKIIKNISRNWSLV